MVKGRQKLKTTGHISRSEDGLKWWQKPSVVYADQDLLSQNDESFEYNDSVSNHSQMVTTIAQNKTNGRKVQNIKNNIKNDESVKRNTRKFRSHKLDINLNSHLTEEFQQLCASYVGSLIDCSFNLPRLSAQMERLMGTNVVRLTDRKYMIALRQRIREDFNTRLKKRIEKREYDEDERLKHLILLGRYSPDNCPDSLVILHSIALATEMERQRNLLMQGKILPTPPQELTNHIVFKTNLETNNIITERRSKLRTLREKNADRLKKNGSKWEGERAKYDEIDRKREKAAEDRQENRLEAEEAYANANRIRGMDLLRIHDRDYVECELELKKFLDMQRKLMLHRGKPSRQRPDPLSKDTRELAVLMRKKPEERVIEPFQLNTMVTEEKLDGMYGKELCKGEEEVEAEEELIKSPAISETCVGVLTKEDHEVMIKETVDNAVAQGYMLDKSQFNQYHYEDPKVTELKAAENVQLMYALADEIIGGTYYAAAKRRGH